MILDVEFPDGEFKEHLDNDVAENTHARADDDVHAIQILDSMFDHVKYSNVDDKSDMRLCIKSRQQSLRHATSGWSLTMLWKNGEEECMPLS